MSIAETLTISGTVVKGHRVASGQTTHSPYPKGTIEMQTPHFLPLGIDLSPFYLGTLNVSIAPHTFKLLAKTTLHDVKWSPHHSAESFSFIPISMIWQLNIYSGLVYYPCPETKINHFQDPAVLELLLPKLEGMTYGEKVTLLALSSELIIKG